MQPARVMFGIPFYQTLEAFAVAKWEVPCAPGSPHRCRKVFNGSSCLTDNFNQLLAMALNSSRRDPVNGPTHIGMGHHDVAPDGYFLTDLLNEQERTGADFLSVVLPIKTEEGKTTTALDDASGFVRRLTKKEIAKLPQSFDAAGAGFPDQKLLIATGLWVMDLRKPWVEKAWPKKYTPGHKAPCFTVPNKLWQDREGEWHASWFSEDWNICRQLHKLGVNIMATKVVPCGHWGIKEYRNDDDLGVERDEGSDCGWADEDLAPAVDEEIVIGDFAE